MFRCLLTAVACSLLVLSGDLNSSEPLAPGVVAVVPTSRDKAQDWRYTFTRPADHWFKPDFNDLSWKTGPGGFGNQGTPNSVDRTPWHTEEIWLRREILLPDGPFTRLQLQVH